MPAFRAVPDKAPEWCEVESFETLSFHTEEAKSINRRSTSECIVVVSGSCAIRRRDYVVNLHPGEKMSIEREDYPYQITCLSDPLIIVRLCGHWGGETGSCGMFELRNSESPRNDGDPVSYPRGTCFDNHYHDFDEYWILINGRCVAISEGRLFLLGPGNCLATGKGHHHDIPLVMEPVSGVYFEGTLEGKKRAGHLWTHRDGPAEVALYRT
jgi:mannose-6-phosphate isomerase-like protein (cupin superfamily)